MILCNKSTSLVTELENKILEHLFPKQFETPSQITSNTEDDMWIESSDGLERRMAKETILNAKEIYNLNVTIYFTLHPFYIST